MVSLPDEPAEPRPHHYHFVHTILRFVAFDRPLDCLAHLGAELREGFLTHLWAMVQRCCEEHGSAPDPDFGPGDIGVHCVRIGDFPCAVVEMPQPRHITESYFAALVVPVALEKLDGPDAPLRYYTLEYGLTMDGPRRTVLCEWTHEGNHVNYGDGPSPTLDAFLAELALRLPGTTP